MDCSAGRAFWVSISCVEVHNPNLRPVWTAKQVTEVAEFLLPMLLSQHMQPLLPRLAFVNDILLSEKCTTTAAKMFTNDDQQLELSLFSKKTDNSKVEYCISRYD